MSFVLINVIYKSQVECWIAISFSVRIRYQEQEQNRDINVVLFPICNNVGDLRIVSGVGLKGSAILVWTPVPAGAGLARTGAGGMAAYGAEGAGMTGAEGALVSLRLWGCSATWDVTGWGLVMFGNNAVVVNNYLPDFGYCKSSSIRVLSLSNYSWSMSRWCNQQQHQRWYTVSTMSVSVSGWE